MIQKIIYTKGIRQNLLIYAGLLVLATIGIYYGNAIKHQFELLRIWEMQNVLILLSGVPFLFLQQQAGIPDFLDETVSVRKRFFWPLVTGAVFGILDILVIKVMQHPEPYTSLPPFLQPFPYSLFLYTSGAFEVEVFYRLIPLTVFLLLGKWIAKGRYAQVFLWAGLILTSLREPLEQFPSGNWLFMFYSLLTGFMMNFLQAWYFRKYGFLASLSVRLGHYLFWHILLGIYVQFVELG